MTNLVLLRNITNEYKGGRKSLNKSNSIQVQCAASALVDLVDVLSLYHFWRPYIDKTTHTINNGVCKVLQKVGLNENILGELNDL